MRTGGKPNNGCLKAEPILSRGLVAEIWMTRSGSKLDVHTSEAVRLCVEPRGYFRALFPYPAAFLCISTLDAAAEERYMGSSW